jgi:hypothetical protein
VLGCRDARLAFGTQPQGLQFCTEIAGKWRAIQDKTANTYVLEV